MDIPCEQYFYQMPGHLVILDNDFNVIRANARVRRDFGDPAGKKCYELLQCRDQKCDICPVERSFRDVQPHRSEGTVQLIDGQVISVLTNSTPILDEAGQVVAVASLMTNISEIKQLQDEVRETEEQRRRLFEEVPCYLSIQDRDLNILDSNRAFRDTFGGQAGMKCYKVYKRRDEECFPCPVRETFRDGRAHTREELVIAKNGEKKNVLVTTNPIRNQDGELVSVMEMIADITTVRQLQDQLSSLGLLVGSISHSLKGLLNGLGGGMYLVNTGLEKGDRGRIDEGWEMVQRNVDRIRDMVSNILYHAKEREPSWEPIEAHELVSDVCNVMRARSGQQGVAIECQIDPDAGTIEADPEAVRSLLVNLVENALDACRLDQAKKEYRIDFRLNGNQEGVSIEVEDNGIGMNQENRARAFSLFYSSKGMSGTGLGLFVAQRIAKAHGGSIELESEEGNGTRFIVQLPRHRPPAPADPVGVEG